MNMCNDDATLDVLREESNDEHLMRLLDALLSLKPDQKQQRVDLLLQMGRRYMALALAREEGAAVEDVEALLARRYERTLTLQSQTEQPDALAQSWYAEALTTCSTALDLAAGSLDRCLALLYRGLVHAICGAPARALEDLNAARLARPYSADIAYWQGLVLAQQGNLKAARSALTFAFTQEPGNERYQRACARLIHEEQR